MGRHWYDDGKMLHKRNTFTDFVACARHVADAGWTTPDDLVSRGGSAGGLLSARYSTWRPSGSPARRLCPSSTR